MPRIRSTGRRLERNKENRKNGIVIREVTQNIRYRRNNSQSVDSGNLGGEDE